MRPLFADAVKAFSLSTEAFVVATPSRPPLPSEQERILRVLEELHGHALDITHAYVYPDSTGSEIEDFQLSMNRVSATARRISNFHGNSEDFDKKVAREMHVIKLIASNIADRRAATEILASETHQRVWS